jgi:hypothetical protein
LAVRAAADLIVIADPMAEHIPQSREEKSRYRSGVNAFNQVFPALSLVIYRRRVPASQPSQDQKLRWLDGREEEGPQG